MHTRIAACTVLAAAIGSVSCGTKSEGSDVRILPAENPESPLADNQARFHFVGRYDVATGKHTIVPAGVEGGALLTTKGFGVLADGNLQFDTLKSTYNGSNPTYGACPTNALCAQVKVTNLTSLPMDDVWIDVTSITSGWSVPNSSTIPPSYAPALNVSIGDWDYGPVSTSSSATTEWKFQGPAGATSFSYTVDALVTFSRTSYSGGADVSATFVDACALGGSVVATGAQPNKASWPLTLPFPVTIYDKTMPTRTATTATTGVIAENGFLTIDSTGLVNTGSNQGALTGTKATNYSLNPFWTSLSMVDATGTNTYSGSSSSVAAASKICTLTQGATGSRTFVVTWKNFTLAGTNSDENFSVVIHENTDAVDFSYGNLARGTGSQQTNDPDAHGGSAVIGIRGGSGTASTTWYDGSGKAGPLTSNSQISFTASPSNPTKK